MYFLFFPVTVHIILYSMQVSLTKISNSKITPENVYNPQNDLLTLESQRLQKSLINPIQKNKFPLDGQFLRSRKNVFAKISIFKHKTVM